MLQEHGNEFPPMPIFAKDVQFVIAALRAAVRVGKMVSSWNFKGGNIVVMDDGSRGKEK